MTSKSKRPAAKSKTSSANTARDPSVVAFKNFTADNLGGFSNGFTGQGKEQYEKMTSDAAEAGRQTWDACLQSGNIFAQGMEQWLQTCANIAQDSANKSGEAVKELMSCKTLSEMTEAQNRLCQEAFNDCIQNATALSEIGIKIATEAFEPLTQQMNSSLKKAG